MGLVQFLKDYKKGSDFHTLLFHNHTPMLSLWIYKINLFICIIFLSFFTLYFLFV